MAKSNFGMIIMMFLAAIIGVVILMQVGSNTVEQTTILTTTNETVNIASARLTANAISNTTNFTLVNAPVLTGKSAITVLDVENGTNQVIYGLADVSIGTAGINWTVNTTTGRITFQNTTYMVTGGGRNNNTFISYTYKTANYVDDGASRVIIPLILLFSALGIGITLFVILTKSDSWRGIFNR